MNGNLVERCTTHETADQESAKNFYQEIPIKMNQLVFSMIEGRNDQTDLCGLSIRESNKSSEPNYMIKLDWNITGDHLLEYTNINNTTIQEIKSYDNPANSFYTGTHADLTDLCSQE